MTFYIDVIFLENIIMNYIILFATGLIIKIKVNHTRLIISSLIGTVYAIMSYISKINVYTNQLVKLLLSVAMIYIAYNPDNLKKLFKDGVIFYLTSFCFGGAAYYLLYYISPQQIKNIGRTLTGSYPVKIAILGGILGFFLINIAFKIIKNKVDKNSIIYNIEIFYKNKSVKTKMLLDTGNLLVEPLTSFPVVIIEKEKMEGMLKGEDLEIISNGIINRFDEISEELRNRCRIIPFSSVGKSNGMIIGIRPDHIKIYEEENIKIIKKVIIGIYDKKLSKSNRYSGLIGLELLNKESERIGDFNEHYTNNKV